MIACPRCHHQNDPGSIRCQSCGTVLAAGEHQVVSDRWEERVRQLLAEDHKIEAIKVYREATGTGLAEAKDAVEALAKGPDTAVLKRSGCLGTLLLIWGAALLATSAVTALAGSGERNFRYLLRLDSCGQTCGKLTEDGYHSECRGGTHPTKLTL